MRDEGDPMKTAQFLQEQPLFGGVDDDAMEAIVPLLQEVTFAAGEVIVREGDDGDAMFLICTGAVEVLKAGPEVDDGLGRRIAVLGVGDVFGEMEVIDMQRRSATVRALEPVTALALCNGDLFRIYESDMPTFTLIVLNLARELSRRLRRIDELAVRCMAMGCVDPVARDARNRLHTRF
jgi:CRP/FNR family cyclic AMP-dependent transcriptional regulator